MADSLEEWARITDRRAFIGGIILFLVVILLLIFDFWIESWLDFPANTILVATPLLAVAIIKLWQRRPALQYLERDVDWRTLIFHLMLFAKGSALGHVGLTAGITSALSNLAGRVSPQATIAATVWICGFFSAILDNAVVVGDLIPAAQALATQLGSTAPWWALLFGASFGGNLTMVGSTANIVALGELERRTGHYMKLGYWLKIALWAAIIPMAIGTGVLLLFG